MINIKDILVLIILFAANLLQAITGFAGTLISMPPVLKLIGIIPVFVGTVIGTKLVKIIPQEIFMKLTYILLLLSGIMAII